MNGQFLTKTFADYAQLVKTLYIVGYFLIVLLFNNLIRIKWKLETQKTKFETGNLTIEERPWTTHNPPMATGH